MVEYCGGATTLWVPDQLKSVITRPCRYEPDVNRTYEDLAAHYGAVVIPARPSWHAVIGDPNQADAICDRLLHDAHRIELKGRSMRRTHDAPPNRRKETT